MKRESLTEGYLRQATRGLWGRKRREIREELELHLRERMTAHRIGGLSEREAEAKVLAELGAPQMVSAGMTRLYTLPTVMGSSVALIALFLGVVALWPKGFAQTLEGTFYWPSVPCVDALTTGEPQRQKSACFTFMNQFWVSQEALQTALEPQGVEFSRVRGPAAELLKISLPGTTAVYVPLSSSEGYDETVFVDDKAYTKSAEYLSFWGLVARLAVNDDTVLRVSGWNEPTFHLNDIKFDLDDGVQRLRGKAFYENYLHAIFNEAIADSLWDTYRGVYALSLQDLYALAGADNLQTPGLTWRRLELDKASLQDSVYGMITYIETPEAFADDFKKDETDDRQAGATFLFQIAQLTKSGTLPIRLPEHLKVQPSFGESFGFGKQLNPGDSILVRLAGSNPETGGWYEVVSPERITLEPR